MPEREDQTQENPKEQEEKKQDTCSFPRELNQEYLWVSIAQWARIPWK